MVGALCQQPRSASQPEQLARAANWIEKQWTEMGLAVASQPIPGLESSFVNLMVSFGPTDAPRIVVGAHYDTVADSPGADDNASGVAALIELANLLRGAQLRDRRIDLVAFTLEEQPYFMTEQMGSRVYAKSLADAGVTVTLMLSLEMIGYFSEEPNSQSYPDPALAARFGDKGNYLTLVGRQTHELGLILKLAGTIQASTGLTVVPFPTPDEALAVNRSDHVSFWKHGFPGVMVTDTADFRNRHYHRDGDHPDTLNYARMADVVAGIHAFLTQAD
jgi:Zn-dependent M28 family amino/carboxypeptidase